MRVVITGASGGIGKAFAYKFAKKGYNLTLVARREELLKQITNDLVKKYDIDCDYLVCDVTKDTKRVYEYCVEKNYEVLVLVNNAGYGDVGEFVDADINKTIGMIELNDRALVELTYYFANHMKNIGYGHIINVGSIASFIPGPYMATYCASKAFVLNFSLGIKEELKKYGVHVSVLCPGATDTQFFENARANNLIKYAKPILRSASKAAETGIRLIDNKKAYVIDGIFNKAAIQTIKLIPLEATAKLMGAIIKVLS